MFGPDMLSCRTKEWNNGLLLLVYFKAYLVDPDQRSHVFYHADQLT